MTEISVAPPTHIANDLRPYAPSWFDRFADWVDSLSISAGRFYAALAAILAGVQIIVEWDGSGGIVYGFPLVYIVTIVYVLALMHHLDKLAAQALERFHPMLKLNDLEYRDVLYRLTTLPARPVAVAAVIGALFGISTLIWLPEPMKVSELHFSNTVLSLQFNHALSLFIWGVIGVSVYHTIHQLRVVQQIYKACSGIDLYKLRPLYAFSTLSGWTAVGIALIIYVWYLFAPSLFNIGIAGLVVFTSFALLTFVVPLWGARRLLVEEKEQHLSKNAERRRLLAAELHRRIDANEMTDMDNLNKTLASLELEYTAIDRISTWPWRTETVRTVTAALFVPVVVWLFQWILRRILEA
jgi:hypothetical protein